MKPLLSKEEIADLLTPLGSELDTDTSPGPIEQIHIEAGRIELTASELQLLQKGAILTTEATADPPLELYVRNTLIGRAKRIQIDGKQAFKVLELIPPTR